ncbi:predicted integral membrane protein [Sanguibacter keddieii DSM 10542]|uniref:Predicted integral membrane protein n=1 Tax=Sanguibacter keddieii (strain ATCC 51767 / DSM 10542 / NCFB 3025 / ST-74) TaxID=446469 RepID=D1BJS7_SANKS|nr:anthrone oxygenase family protein [Sanguibacter keddieii]ACZ20333.1 predicted integral membrane protein [Sanguibacter keddieii DSM 10542]
MTSSTAHLLAACGAAVTGGVYLAFSAMVMPALRSRPAADAIATMQQVNLAAVRPPFMVVFFGAAASAVVVVVVEVVRARGDGAVGLGTVVGVAGAALSLAGFVVTVTYNVPRNDLVAGLDPSSAAGQARWLTLAREWTGANTLRGALSVLGAALLGTRVLLP